MSAALNVRHVRLELHGVVPETVGNHGGPFTTTASPRSNAGLPVVTLIQDFPMTRTARGAGVATGAERTPAATPSNENNSLGEKRIRLTHE